MPPSTCDGRRHDVLAADQSGARGQQREDAAGDRDGAVDGNQGDLVRRRQQPLGDDRDPDDLLRRLGEQPGGLDDELRDVEPDQVVADRDGRVEHARRQLADDHRLAPVELVGDGGGERAEEQVRREPHEDHAGDRDALRGRRLLAGELLCQGGVGEQPEPVAEAGERDGGPHPAEHRDPEQRQHAVLPARRELPGRRIDRRGDRRHASPRSSAAVRRSTDTVTLPIPPRVTSSIPHSRLVDRSR